jgi:hypothetical protein
MLTALTLATVLHLAPDARAPALAQESAPAPKTTAAQGKKKKVLRLEALTVEGRIQKPEAFYILQRSQLSFEELNRTESFLPKVEKSVEAEPF